MSTVRRDPDEILVLLRRAGLEFVIVGVGGINFYARDPSEAFATMDLDLMVPPRPEVLRRFFEVLGEAGFTFEAGGEPFVDVEHRTSIEAVIRSGANLRALDDDGNQLDLMFSMAGADYGEISVDAVAFEVSGERILVGRLEKLLRSKELSDRPKDRAFLEAFRARAETPATPGRDARVTKKRSTSSSKKKRTTRPK